MLECDQSEGVAYEVVEFREPPPQPGQPYKGRSETTLGEYDSEQLAIEHGRLAWKAGRASDSLDVVWWIVRVPREQLARWLADGASEQEQVLDLTTNAMVPINN